jgi:hypothetical protein
VTVGKGATIGAGDIQRRTAGELTVSRRANCHRLEEADKEVKAR